MEPLLSVIVPVYKVEPYLRRCVDSIINQTYQNLEIILVDDGSPDNCGAICDEYAEKDPRVKVIHKENRGQAVARNVGLATSTGEYLCFVDSDDWLDPHLFTNVFEKAPFGVAIFGMELAFAQADKNRRIPVPGAPGVLSWEQDIATVQQLLNSSLLGYACNKVYRRDAIGALTFTDIKLREDLLFNLTVCSKDIHTVLVDCEGYFYFQRDDSTLHNRYNGHVPDIANTALLFQCVHPKLPAKANRELSNCVIKQYLCDSLHKFVFNNASLNQNQAISEISKLFSYRQLAKILCFSALDNTLMSILTACIKLNAPKIFYRLLRRIWHE